jgi:glucose-6-phosphate 1-dehydrogenase
MEPPSSLEPSAIRNEILKVFQSFRPIKEIEIKKSAIRGQYLSSKVKGQKLPVTAKKKESIRIR